MQSMRFSAGILAGVIASSLVLTSEASAQTAAEAACRAAIGKNVGKYVTSVLKTTIKCHRKRTTGKISPATDCNDVAQADANGKLARRRDKLRAAITGTCSGAAGVLSQYARCPAPAHLVDDGGDSDGIDGLDELGDCMAGLVDDLVASASYEVMGHPADQLPTASAKCQASLGKATMKLLKTYFKVRSSCQKDLDAANQGLAYGCEGFDAGGKITKAELKLAKLVDKSCGLPDPVATTPGNERIDAIGACGDTLAQLKDCLTDEVGARLGSGMVAMAYELPADCRAGGLVRYVYSAFGRRITRTVLGAGSNGIGHSFDFADRFADPLSLECDADCAACQISFNTDPARTVPVCRCSNEPKTPCDTINGSDPACSGLGASCICRFGPPLATLAAGNPACVDIRVTGDYSGTVNLGNGHIDNPLSVNAVIYLGLNTLAPCPQCVGDVVENDGVRDGTCSGGAQNNQPCDSNGTTPVFGPVSIDCQPPGLTNISGQGLPLNFELISADQSLPFTLPCDDAGYLCPCRTCSGDTSIGCRNDAECPPGTGTCSGGGGAGVHPNGCSDLVCGSDSRCVTGPIDSFCSSPTKPNGEGLIGCNSNFDCSDGATCSIQEKRRCYPDPITVGGKPSLFRHDVGGLACIGVTTSAVINLAAALPGPVRVALHHDSEVTCESDPSIVWNPPGGSNCTPVTTTTTTTLFPPLPCLASLAPACDGTCPVGEVCEPVPPLNQTCQCNPVVTTTTLPAGCGDVYPLCGQGTCPSGESCNLNGTLTACECTPGTACADTLFPICGGECSPGSSCQGDILGLACACSP